MKNEYKIIICRDVTPSGATSSKQLSISIANLLLSIKVDCSKIDYAVLSSAIINAQTIPNSIQLIIQCLSTWDEKQTMGVLAKLSKPFRHISSYGKRPKIINDKINLTFAKLLETKGFISSLKEEKKWIKINTFKSSRHVATYK